MMAVYSHVRGKALDDAAKALESGAPVAPPTQETATTGERDPRVTSHVTSQQPPRRTNLIEFLRKVARPARLRSPTTRVSFGATERAPIAP
jgi:hypothetical protein